ncbi:unnamed protein product [Nezara viridula]|uniref:Uncharacterized protein n=1 Tax=Nezara viridula TaxID=85310 RepID=A0A9P0HIH4_NEZVI|nr:unnamed protein product [Nezara viridula]
MAKNSSLPTTLDNEPVPSVFTLSSLTLLSSRLLPRRSSSSPCSQSVGWRHLFLTWYLGYQSIKCLVHVNSFLLITCPVQVHFLMSTFSTISGRSVLALIHLFAFLSLSVISRRYRSIPLTVILNL